MSRTEQGIYLSQEQYGVDLLHDESLENLKPATAPMDSKVNFNPTDDNLLDQEMTTRYRRILGCLQYLTTTCPDISYVVSKMSQYFAKPSKDHWQSL